MSKAVFIATRGSDLAVAQAQQVLQHCQRAFPDRAFQLKIIKTTGDKLQAATLASSSLPKGLFTKELETALLDGHAALAVHSLKDLPTELPSTLALGAVLPREDVRDVLVYRDRRRPEVRGLPRLNSLADLPLEARLATSSTRRAAQAQFLRPDLRVDPIRGNVPTRLQKLLNQPEADALLLALAGLKRLGYQITHDGSLQLRAGSKLPPLEGLMATILPLDEMLPCVGQGAIAIEVRAGDHDARNLCAGLNHPETFSCIAAERALLQALGGGCQLPLGAHAQHQADKLHLQAISFLGPAPRQAQADGSPDAPDTLGRHLANLLQSES